MFVLFCFGIKFSYTHYFLKIEGGGQVCTILHIIYYIYYTLFIIIIVHIHINFINFKLQKEIMKIDFCTLAPEKLPKVVFIDVSSACQEHDYDYGLIYKRPNNKKYRMIRKEYDRQFKENLRLLGAPAVFCWVYWFAVRCFGWVGLWGREDVKGLV